MTPLARTLSFFVVFWLHQLSILPQLLILTRRARRVDPVTLRPRLARISQNWGRMMCRLGGARVRCEDLSGRKEGEAVLLVSNHQGDFDIPLLLAHGPAPLAFVAKKELERIPLVSSWMRLMGCVFLDREDRRRQVQQIRETVDLLQSGLTMVIFPEGTRSRSPQMGEFAKGSLNIAERAGVRIVPVSLRDSYALLPKGCRLLPGGKVRIRLHPAIDPAALSPEARARLHLHVQEIIATGLEGD